MRTAEYILVALKHIGFLVLSFLFVTSAYSQDSGEENVIYWHIKAVFLEAKLMDIKAIDKDGAYHDVKAIQDSHDINLLSVKAFVDGKTLPIKMIISENDKHYPVKAIDYEGRILDVKAIGEKGEVYEVKGVSRMGSLIEVRAIDEQQGQHDVISISPIHGVNHVKGLKMFSEDVEAVIHGVKIFAHVKSLKQY